MCDGVQRSRDAADRRARGQQQQQQPLAISAPPPADLAAAAAALAGCSVDELGEWLAPRVDGAFAEELADFRF